MGVRELESRRWVVPSLIGLALLCVSAPSASAEEQNRTADSRCEWTDCSTSERPEQSARLRTCREEDRASCAEECRTEFDQEHFRCIDRCLAKRCTQVSEERSPRPDAQWSGWQSDLCLEGESAACESECRAQTDVHQPRCRLVCLKRLCPKSLKGEIAEEAAKPGSVACRRCRAREERECRRACGVGLSLRPGGSYSGLGSYACEKACISGACGGGCAF